MFLDDGTEKTRMSIIEETSSSRLSLERIERSLKFIESRLFEYTPVSKRQLEPQAQVGVGAEN